VQKITDFIGNHEKTIFNTVGVFLAILFFVLSFYFHSYELQFYIPAIIISYVLIFINFPNMTPIIFLALGVMVIVDRSYNANYTEARHLKKADIYLTEVIFNKKNG
jgi:hypothetical protein